MFVCVNSHNLEKEIKAKCQQALANDIPEMCSKARDMLRSYYNCDSDKMKGSAWQVVDSIINCYGGGHRCCRNTIVGRCTCSGHTKRTWLDRSHHLRGQKIVRLNMTQADRNKILEVLRMVLGRNTIEKTARGITTLGCESRFSGVSTSIPKNKRFPRNCHGKLHSSAHRMNNGPEASMLAKLNNGAVL